MWGADILENIRESLGTRVAQCLVGWETKEPKGHSLLISSIPEQRVLFAVNGWMPSYYSGQMWGFFKRTMFYNDPE